MYKYRTPELGSGQEVQYISPLLGCGPFKGGFNRHFLIPRGSHPCRLRAYGVIHASNRNLISVLSGLVVICDLEFGGTERLWVEKSLQTLIAGTLVPKRFNLLERESWNQHAFIRWSRVVHSCKCVAGL